ncbi:MAG: hypothetical protein ACJ74J_06015 [Blastocatellia bacterium]
MSKQGATFIRIIEDRERQPAVWDPHRYRYAEQGGKLGDYVEVRGLRRLSAAPSSSFRAIEYSDISRGDHLTFTLEESAVQPAAKHCVVGEQQLLMGTMRAYLGNIIVTPRADWLGRTSPLSFAVKSEFVQLVPRDGLIYFWWAYLRSAMFLALLPVGGGGTRPRLQPDVLAAASVNVPDLEKRTEIHKQLARCAAREWREAAARRAILDSIFATD